MNWFSARSLSLLFSGLLIPAAGCSRQTSESTSAPGPAEAASVENPAVPAADTPTAVAPAAAQAPASPDPTPSATAATGATAPQPQLEGAVHLFMTSQLRRYIDEHGRMPSSFAEFASARMDSVPFAPDGMEYVIDEQRREVKVVKKKR